MTPEERATTIANLEMILGSGEMTTEYAGRRVTYQNVDQIERALAYLKRTASEAAPNAVAPASRQRSSYAEFSRD